MARITTNRQFRTVRTIRLYRARVIGSRPVISIAPR
jgi:hypothetical protein